MFLPFPVLILGSQLAIAVADTVPKLDVSPSCRAAADEAMLSGGNRSKMESCLRQENDARNQIGKDWSQYPRADRDICVSSTSTGGIPSYVELLTCLEIARDARKLSPSTTGAAPR